MDVQMPFETTENSSMDVEMERKMKMRI